MILLKSITKKSELDIIDSNKKIVVFCQSGIRSKKAVELLRDSGITNAVSFKGGVMNMITNIKNIFKQFKSDGFWLIGIENSIDAKPWFKVEYGGKAIIVLGSEGKGIRKMVLESCDFISTIPMKGKINSLNVSATASAILFERLRQVEGN